MWRFLAAPDRNDSTRRKHRISSPVRCARGRSRTGMGFPPRDFRTHYSFRCCAQSEHIWGLDFTFAVSSTERGRELGRGRQVSTLSPRAAAATHEALSSVLQPPRHAAVPPTLTPFAWTFPFQVLNCSSPLRLPVSPPGHLGAAGFYTSSCERLRYTARPTTLDCSLRLSSR